MNAVNIRSLRNSLSPARQHYVLFFSPVLDRLVIPYAVQTDVILLVETLESAKSVCNTRTKVWYPILNDQKSTCTKPQYPAVNDIKGAA